MEVMISVIVPLYNVEFYLRRCINSILNQSFVNFELLLIDDGSIDTSGIICNEYAEKDRRIKVFHKENGGVSSARNVGLANAKGTWIAFVDADDWVEPDYLKNLIDHVDDSIDLVISYTQRYTKGANFRKEIYPSKLISDKNFEEMFIENDMHWHTAPWSKLYRIELIKRQNIIFCEGMYISEDALFNFQVMMCSRSIYISNDTDYIYSVDTESSLTKRVFSIDSELQTYHNIANIVSSMIEAKQIKHPKALHNLYYLNALNIRRVLNALYYNSASRTERINILESIDIQTYVNYIGKCSKKEELLKIFLRCKCIWLYDLVRTVAILFHREVHGYIR